MGTFPIRWVTAIGVWIGCATFAARAQDAEILLTQVRADATIDSISGDVANGAGDFLLISRDFDGRERRTLLYFAVQEAIPPGSVILDASLSFRLIVGNAPVRIWRITESWREGFTNPSGDETAGAPASARDVTWNYRNFGSLTPWSRPGGGLAPQPSGEFDAQGTEFLYTVSLGQAAIAADLQTWVDHPDQNHGWCLAVGESSSAFARIESKESPDNYKPHLWVRYYLPAQLPVNYCDSTINSSGQAARLGWSGSTSWAANDLHLTVRGAPHGTVGMLACGPSAAYMPFGNGYLCINSTFNNSVHRFALESVSAQGTVDHPIDFLSPAAQFIHPSSLWHFQFWFRDASAQPAGFNLSDGLFVVVYP